MKKYIISIAILYCFCATSFAADLTISGVTGDASHANNMTVSGVGFSTKTQAAPLTWDNFEDGVCSTATPTVGVDWQGVGELIISSSENRHARSSYNATHNFTTEGTAGIQSNNSYISRKWFVQYWFYIETDFDWGTSTYGGGDQHLANVKFLRFWNPGSVDENWLAIFGFSLDGNAFHGAEYISGDVNNYFDTAFTKNSIEKGVWHCLQFEFLDSSTTGVSDGEFRCWFDGQLIEAATGMLLKEDYDINKRVSLAGFYNAWGAGAGESNHDPNTYRQDDTYVDSSWARIEIGDNADYESCTHREIQIPTEWSDTSISFEFNQGSFAGGSTVYIFVTDDDGNTSEGYAVVIDAASTNPVISSLSDTTLDHGQQITISGYNFGASQGSGSVKISTISQTIDSWSNTSIEFTAYQGGLIDGVSYDCTVISDDLSTSNAISVSFNIPTSQYSASMGSGAITIGSGEYNP